MRHVLSWHLTSSPTVNSDDAIFMRQETDSMCRMECFSVLFTKFYYFLLILKIISWNWLAILHLYPRWSSQQHIYIWFTLSSFFVCLHISPQTEGVRTLQIMSKTSHRAKIHRTGGQNPSYRGQKSSIPCYNPRHLYKFCIAFIPPLSPPKVAHYKAFGNLNKRIFPVSQVPKFEH